MILNRSRLRIVDCNDDYITFYYNGETFKYNVKSHNSSTTINENKFFINNTIKDLIIDYFRCERFKEINIYDGVAEFKTRYHTVYLLDIESKELYLRTEDKPMCAHIPNYSYLYNSFRKRLGNLNDCSLWFAKTKYNLVEEDEDISKIVIELDL